MKRLSVVIPNYNYERYVGEAIESALALDWPDVEVVVVDDGSTDRSLDVIRGFGDDIVVLATENASQRVAVNRGVARSTGDVVIVLDSDDVLPRGAARSLAAVWGPTVSKAQFRMQRIDHAGVARGKPFPASADGVDSQEIRRWLLKTSAYPTPPGSGNAYSRWFLDLVLPVGPELGDAADSALLAAAPLLGDVIQVPEVRVGYRQHGGNDSNLLRDTTRFSREVARARARWAVAREVAPSLLLEEGTLRRSRELLQLRVAARVTHPELPTGLAGDGRMRLLRDSLRSPVQLGPESLATRMVIMVWCVLALLLPRPVGTRLVALRYR